MLHRDKTIGKSLYRVVARPGGYAIREIYNDGKSFAMGLSKQIFQTVDAEYLAVFNLPPALHAIHGHTSLFPPAATRM